MKSNNEMRMGVVLSYLNLAIGCIIPLFYTPIMLEILGQEEYGLFSLSNSVVGYLSLLSFGIGSAVIRYIDMYRAKQDTEGVKRVAGLFLILYSVIAVLVMTGGVVLSSVSGTLFAEGLTGEEINRLRVLILIMAASMAISFSVCVFAAVVLAYERYIFSRAVQVLQTILLPLMNLAALYAGGGAVGLAACSLILQILSGPVYMAYCARKLDIWPSFRNMPVHLLREIGVFCAFVCLSSIVDMLYWATDKVLIGAAMGTAAVAVYNIGGVFTSMMQSIAGAINNIFSPRVTMMVMEDKPMDQLSEMMIKMGRIQYLIISFILSGYIVFGQKFIALWAGDGYQDAYWIALITMLPLAVPLIQNVAFTAIVAANKHRFRSIIYAVIAVINVISTWLILPYHGIIGAAVCTGAAYIIGNGIIMNYYYHRVIGFDISKFWINIGSMSPVPLAMIVVGLLLIRWGLPMDTVSWFLLWVVVYSVIFWMLSWFASMNSGEKEAVKDIIWKLKK